VLYYKAVKSVNSFPKIHTIVKNELFTETEVKKYHIPINLLKSINISRKKTRYLFGSRVEA
jgi:hypothetical protein